jgi:hypothetical protein
MNTATPMPHRIRLSRAKGWRMPTNALKVDRSTKWGNPFIVGQHGTATECVRWYELLAGGLLNLSTGNVDQQIAARATMARASQELRGKDLACWCALDKPCHADMLLQIANDEANRRICRPEESHE